MAPRKKNFSTLHLYELWCNQFVVLMLRNIRFLCRDIVYQERYNFHVNQPHFEPFVMFSAR